MKEPKLILGSDLVKLIAGIDEFKGRWEALKTLSPDRLSALRKVATPPINSSPRRGRRHVRNRRVRQAVERHFLPRALPADERPQQLVVQRMPRLVAAEFADQAMPQ